MGAGISAKQSYRIQYNGLKRVQSDLLTAGVKTVYKDRELRPLDGNAFGVWYTAIGPASNGESALLMVVKIGDQTYGGTTKQSVDAGFARLRSEFGTD